MARQVKVLGDGVVLPDGNLYNTDDETILTNAQYFAIDPDLIAEDDSALIQDLGSLGIVIEQGPMVDLVSEAPPAATATPGDSDNTELLADIQSLRETAADLVTDFGVLRAALTGETRALSGHPTGPPWGEPGEPGIDLDFGLLWAPNNADLNSGSVEWQEGPIIVPLELGGGFWVRLTRDGEPIRFHESWIMVDGLWGRDDSWNDDGDNDDDLYDAIFWWWSDDPVEEEETFDITLAMLDITVGTVTVQPYPSLSLFVGSEEPEGDFPYNSIWMLPIEGADYDLFIWTQYGWQQPRDDSFEVTGDVYASYTSPGNSEVDPSSGDFYVYVEDPWWISVYEYTGEFWDFITDFNGALPVIDLWDVYRRDFQPTLTHMFRPNAIWIDDSENLNRVYMADPYNRVWVDTEVNVLQGINFVWAWIDEYHDFNPAEDEDDENTIVFVPGNFGYAVWVQEGPGYGGNWVDQESDIPYVVEF